MADESGRLADATRDLTREIDQLMNAIKDLGYKIKDLTSKIDHLK
jgi:prefoldin subunit 5